MNRKRLFQFYFSAEKLEKAFNNLTLKYALSSAEYCAEYSARKIIKITEYKQSLSELWGYMDDVMQKLSKEERWALRRFGLLRHGLDKEPAEIKKLIRRSAVKFQRMARRTERFTEALVLIDKYCCLF